MHGLRRSENRVTAVDHKCVARMIGRGIRREINRDAAEVAGLAPATRRNAWDHFFRKRRALLCVAVMSVAIQPGRIELARTP